MLNWHKLKHILFLLTFLFSQVGFGADESNLCRSSHILESLTSTSTTADDVIDSAVRATFPEDNISHVIHGDFENGRLLGGMHTTRSVNDFQSLRASEVQALLDLPESAENANRIRKFLRQYTNNPYYQNRISLDEPIDSLNLILRRFENLETQTFPNGVIEVRIPSELIANSYRKKLKAAARNEPYMFDTDSQTYVKTLFPNSWDSQRVQDAAQFVFQNPSRQFNISDTAVAREGIFEGVNVRIVSSPTGEIRTIYPIRPSDQQGLH